MSIGAENENVNFVHHREFLICVRIIFNKGLAIPDDVILIISLV